MGGSARSAGSASGAQAGPAAGLSLPADHAGHHAAGPGALSDRAPAGGLRAALAAGTLPGRLENDAGLGWVEMPFARAGREGAVGGINRAQPAAVRDGPGRPAPRCGAGADQFQRRLGWVAAVQSGAVPEPVRPAQTATVGGVVAGVGAGFGERTTGPTRTSRHQSPA